MDKKADRWIGGGEVVYSEEESWIDGDYVRNVIAVGEKDFVLEIEIEMI